MSTTVDRSDHPHVKQLLVEQLLVLQLLPPRPAGELVPEAANRDSLRLVFSDLHCGHITCGFSPRTSSSNSLPHSVHRYSYIGMVPLF